jgi:galactose mutarotase-like enzyme
VHTFSEQAAVTIAADDTEVTFLPEMGMLGVSLRHQGRQYLDLHGGVEAFEAGHTTGLPILHPWANRLSALEYDVGDVHVDLRGLDLQDDGQGHPIHGTMIGARGWDVAWTEAGPAAATLRARFDFGAHPDLLASFPFPHEIIMEATVDGALSVTTSVRATGTVPVPVTFGYHPYFRLPGAKRADVRLGLPARQHALLNDQGLPSGGSDLESAEVEPIGGRTFDDLYALGEGASLELDDGTDRLAVTYDRGYPYAQIYAPPGREFVAIEPMTALTDGLVTARCPLLAPGETFRARFTVSIRPS